MEYKLENCESLYCTPETYNTINSTIPQLKKQKPQKSWLQIHVVSIVPISSH